MGAIMEAGRNSYTFMYMKNKDVTHTPLLHKPIPKMPLQKEKYKAILFESGNMTHEKDIPYNILPTLPPSCDLEQKEVLNMHAAG